MKIVKQHKNRSVHSEAFGIYSGKTLAEVNANNCSHGGTMDQIHYIKIGDCSHGAFLWIDDLDEAKVLGDKLIEFWAESRRRECKED
jgi:hypothetical protein